jgi:hypothetical protein
VPPERQYRNSALWNALMVASGYDFSIRASLTTLAGGSPAD